MKLLKLRNPWGMREWDGPWGDGKGEWETALGQQVRRHPPGGILPSSASTPAPYPPRLVSRPAKFNRTGVPPGERTCDLRGYCPLPSPTPNGVSS